MKLFLTIAALLTIMTVQAQELFVATEPASNMPKNSIALRTTAKLMNMSGAGDSRYRTETAVMLGLSKNLMVHAGVEAGNAFTGKLRLEGGSLYAKYRFLSKDEVHSHFRMAAFAKLALSGNPVVYQTNYKYYIDHGNGPEEHIGAKGHIAGDIDLDGNNSGWQTGVVATQLLHKFAVSASAGYIRSMANAGGRLLPQQPRYGFTWTTSAGYLLLPREYTSYKQVNVNLYAELLGTALGQGKGHYMDFAPAVQLIFNSILRVDVGANFYIAGKVHRMTDQQYLLRVEYNFLNSLNRRKK